MLDSLFRIFKWSPDYRNQTESLIVNRWIRLPGLPSNYCALACLEGIGNSISRCVEADEIIISKQKPVYARMSLELDLSKELPNRVWLGISPEKGVWQNITIEV